MNSYYEIKKLDINGGTVSSFHQWANGKPFVGGYTVTKLGGNTVHILLIDWHRNDNYYLVIYAENKATTLAEIHQIEEQESQRFLKWRYNPLKRDGKNPYRKAYFKQLFGDTLVNINIPSNINEVDSFLTQLFKLCENRSKADQIVDKFPY
ncbi:hypothetical protein [Bacillus sp. 2205SS5-2]|uniref:hypothetical protein n=1 Tax=Bacillus sp. 2205SS5-2 TaxID=3109031 RepID=UPI00300415C9